MRAPEITYLYRQGRDVASNSLEILQRRTESTSGALTSSFQVIPYTVPLDRILVLTAAMFRMQSDVIIPTPADQVFYGRILCRPQGVSSTGPANNMIAENQEFLAGATGRARSFISFSGEYWCPSGSSLVFIATAVNADTISVSASVAGLLIPKGNVALA